MKSHGNLRFAGDRKTKMASQFPLLATGLWVVPPPPLFTQRSPLPPQPPVFTPLSDLSPWTEQGSQFGERWEDWPGGTWQV